jgi:hypothetical protein
MIISKTAILVTILFLHQLHHLPINNALLEEVLFILLQRPDFLRAGLSLENCHLYDGRFSGNPPISRILSTDQNPVFFSFQRSVIMFA